MTVKCRVCKQDKELSCTPEQYKTWLETDKLIQDVMPNVTPDQRELLISDTCGECFDEMFGAMMTNRDKVIADALKNQKPPLNAPSWDYTQWNHDVDAVADAIQRVDKLFDRRAFLERAGRIAVQVKLP